MENPKKIILNNGHLYTGEIVSEDNFFIQIIDKFNLHVRLSKKEISVIRDCSPAELKELGEQNKYRGAKNEMRDM